MNNSNRSDPTDKDPGSDRALAEIFSRATPRPAPPAADEAEIREALYREWDAVTGRRVWVRRVGVAAAAGFVIVATALLFTIDSGTGLGPAVARVERLQGTVRIGSDDGANEAARIADELASGSIVSTGDGQVAMRLVDGGSLRLAPRTELKLIAKHEIQLIAGALYFDSESEFSEQRLSVLTPMGTVRDIGTQFMARLDAGSLEVGVRDGRVAIAREDDGASAGSGERLVVPGGAGNIRRSTISTFGNDWAWAESLAPPFDIDGRQLIDFLSWVAGQTGRRLEFSNPAAEQIARDTVLRGSIDLEPLPKLTAVLAITDLGYVIDGQTILISTK